MGREAEVLPSDVLTILQNNRSATRAEIARELECSIGTVSRKISELVKDGEPIGFNKQGLFIQDKNVMSDTDADQARAWINRIFNSLKMWAQRGNNHKAIAIEARKRIAKELTRDERNKLRGELLLITRVIDATNLDEDLQA